LKAGAERRIEAMHDKVFLYRHPLRLGMGNRICLDDRDISYAEAVAAVDGVITKPGYGIAADCLVHGTPVIYTDRGLFPEYDILVREMRAHLTSAYLPSQDLYAGRWQGVIEHLERLPRRFPAVTANGAEVVARVILDLLALRE
jgi:hypothetical protein